MRNSHPIAVCLSLLLAGSVAAAPKIVFDSEGFTNETNNARFSFTLKGLAKGQVMKVENFVEGVVVAGIAIPATGITPMSDQKKPGGKLSVSAVIPSGKQKVKITVILTDGTKIPGEGTVNFVKPKPKKSHDNPMGSNL